MKPTITVFINPKCGPCLRLKEWLKKNDIHFIEKDIVNDEKVAKEFSEAGGQYTPTTLIEFGEEKHRVIGANVAKLERILEVTQV